MAKVVTSYLIEEDLKKELLIIKAVEGQDNASDLFKFLIDIYKKSRVQNEVPVIQTKEEV